MYAHAAFWLPVYYYSVSAEPEETRPVPRRCQAFFLPFPACDIIVYSPKTHTNIHTRLGYSLGGAQGAGAVAAGVFSGPGQRHVVVPRRSLTRVPLTAMKRGAGYGIFSPDL